MNFRQLSVKTDASTWPVTLAEAKQHLRVTSSAEDTLIEALIPTATVMVENYTNLGLAQRTLIMRCRDWPCEELVLWYPLVTSVVAVRYLDQEGVEQTLDPSVYQVDIEGSLRPSVSLGWTQTWPIIRPQHPSPVRVEYNSGYGASIPTPLKQAILMMMADLYENRESQITSQYFGERSVIQNPTIARILTPYTIGN